MLLDDLIAVFSPERGLKRKRARLAMEYLAATKRAFEGARKDRRTAGWLTTSTSANAEIGPAATYLRDRARDLVRNNPYAAKAVEVYTHNLVGTGILPRAKSASAADDKKAMEAWKAWAPAADATGQTDIYGLQALVARARFESGEVLVRRRWRRAEDGLPVPMQLEVLEPDFLDTTKDGVQNGANLIVQGIEFDPLGRRAAYWLFQEHPGDAARFLRKSFQSRRVPAADIIHVFRRERPGQDLGVTAFAPVVMKLQDLDAYDEAELIRKQIAATQVMVVTSPESGTGSTPVVGEQSTESGTGAKLEKMRPGMITRLRPGETTEFNTPPGDSNYQAYMSVQGHVIAAGLKMPYELLTSDFSGVNYSSFRGSLLEFRALLDADRWLMFIPGFCNRVWAWFTEAAAVAGVLAAKPYPVVWTPPKYEMVDPFKDAQADKMMMRCLTKTPQQAVAEQGYDFEEQVEEYAAALKLFDKFGFVLDIDPRKTADAGTVQAEPDTATQKENANAA
jgi:lambda family phage portal protein